jgi:hypothetical protein
VCDDVFIIPLVSKAGLVRATVVVDASDYEKLSKHKWNLWGDRYGYRYEKGRPILMHREILGTECEGLEVDHINRNGLDNRRCNLRAVTHAQNMQNCRPQIGAVSQYRGVGWVKSKRRWVAKVRNQGIQMTLGYFRSEFTAALVAKYFRFVTMPYAED